MGYNLSGVYLLLDDLELLDQDASKLFYNMRAVVCSLETNNNLLHNIIMDAGQVNFVVGSM